MTDAKLHMDANKIPIGSVRTEKGGGRLTMTKYGQRLVEAMGKTGYSVYDLAEKSGIAKTTIYATIERGTLPSAYTLATLAEALGVTMDWLWGRTDK